MYNFIVLLMIFAHIVDDFYLQSKSIVVSLKQKKWWKENQPEVLYEYDYIVGLVVHSFSWAFMIMLPLAWYFYDFKVDIIFFFILLINMTIHALVDHLKANKLKINLITDQTLHLLQILATYTTICGYTGG